LLKLINPVQFPLHEPYFDLTPIRAAHRKIIKIGTWRNCHRSPKYHQTYCTLAPFSAWRVVSTYPRYTSPWRTNSRLL